jgi:hypothetical protein
MVDPNALFVEDPRCFQSHHGMFQALARYFHFSSGVELKDDLIVPVRAMHQSEKEKLTNSWKHVSM